jgi:DNA repair exonuclease SbcCD ATPase subunit
MRAGLCALAAGLLVNRRNDTASLPNSSSEASLDLPNATSEAPSAAAAAPSVEASTAHANAKGAEAAAHAAETAAHVAREVATHAKLMHTKSQDALKHARSALSSASEGNTGMTDAQKKHLKNADDALAEATKKLETEKLEQDEWVKEALEESEAQVASRAATERLQKQIDDLEERVKAAKDEKMREEFEEEIDDLKDQLNKQIEAEKHRKGEAESLGKMKDELEKMKRQLETMEDIKELKAKINGKVAERKKDEEELLKKMQELDDLLEELEKQKASGEEISPVAQDALDKELRNLKTAVANKVKSEEEAAEAEAKKEEERKKKRKRSYGGQSVEGMPYGELEPFGREDTAAELTQDSIAESDKMVDQIEKAEVAEEKRSVFRALTRLRGAAITSYDGVARSQTGNIAEYNHHNKWRDLHPVHHLAEEENDVEKWAFPDNAD